MRRLPAEVQRRIMTHLEALEDNPLRPGALQLANLLPLTVERRASDLHLNAHYRPVLRIHGKLVDMAEHPPLQPEDTEAMARALLSGKQYDEFEARRDLDFSYELSTGERFRAAATH